MQKILRWIGKAFIAGIVSLCVMSAFCTIYYNPSIHVPSKTGATDYVREPGFTSRMTEGIAWATIDKNGFYNNAAATDKNMDILVMGSSQVEGAYLNAKYRLSDQIEAMSGKSVYNLGMASHNFLRCTKNLETALETMQPQEYVIFEMNIIDFSNEDVEQCLSGKINTLSSYDSGLLYTLQKINYAKLLYQQLKWWSQEEISDEPMPPEAQVEDYLEAYQHLLNYVSETCQKHGVQAIVVFHPHLLINKDGTVTPEKDDATFGAFQKACTSSGIPFVDMTDDFLNAYYENGILPHGFCNTAVGTGHLNRDGTELIARRITALINEAEGC